MKMRVFSLPSMEKCKKMSCFSFNLLVMAILHLICLAVGGEMEYTSAVGDPGMQRDGLRVALESWNQCNEVGEEAPSMGSPRRADCFDVYKSATIQEEGKNCPLCKFLPYILVHRVTELDNNLGIRYPYIGENHSPILDPDHYAAQKELYLGSKCEVPDDPNPWQFWMIMLKSGNTDLMAAKCPNNGHKVGPTPQTTRFPCFGPGCMNQPLMFQKYTSLQGPQKNILRGSFYGSWDLDARFPLGTGVNTSSYSVTWEKEVGKGSWVFHHVLRTSNKYPWLMLYLRSDATTGFSGGYHYQTRGMSKIIPESPNFKVRFTLNVIQGGGPNSQFYLMDIGSCWKNNGQPCDGDVTTDVTRYSEMILNPSAVSGCTPETLARCPLYHTFSNGTLVYRNDTARFPYKAYHLHCSPGNAEYLEEPYEVCDPYSNTQPQEILQILPHPVWGEYGYPTEQGGGWIGDPKTWELDVGRLSQSLYFYQDPGTEPVKRRWPSIDLGTEIYRTLIKLQSGQSVTLTYSCL